MKVFCHILPQLQSQKGHLFEYAMATKAAAEKEGWFHTAWIPVDCKMNCLPSNWKKVIPNVESKYKNKFGKNLAETFLNGIEMRKEGIKFGKDEEVVFFLEHFRISHLTALFFSLLFAPFSFKIWILHRYSEDQMILGGKLHSILYRFFGFIFGRKTFSFFSDSDLLSLHQEEILGQKVKTLPIPHGKSESKEKFLKSRGEIYCWWPGGDISERKGFQVISRLSRLLQQNPSSPIKLILSEEALSKGVVPSSSILFVESELSRESYEKWLNTADAVLLPYCEAHYRRSTSGIFVESICNGTLPLTSSNTWMAYELEKFGLTQLLIDWNSPSILVEIERLIKTYKNCEHLSKMKEAYSRCHTVDNFSNILFDANFG